MGPEVLDLFAIIRAVNAQTVRLLNERMDWDER